MNKVLITGSEGLIGKKLVKHYTDLKYKVIGYDWISDKNNEHYHWNNIKGLKFNIIHHCANQCIIREVIANPGQAYQNNQITYKVMELARKILLTNCSFIQVIVSLLTLKILM